MHSNDHKVISTIPKHQMAIYVSLVFFYFLIELIQRIPSPSELNAWCTTPYTMSYAYGLGSRFFMGSIFEALLNPISLKRLYVLILLSTLVCAFLCALFVAKTLKHTAKKIRIGVAYLIILLLASPASPAFLFYWGNFGRMDLYLIGIVLIAALMMPYSRLRPLAILLIPIGMAIHQVFLFTYCPVIIALFIYEGYHTGFMKRDRIITFSALLLCALSFGYFQFTKIALPFDDAASLAAYLTSQSNIPISEKMLEYEYFHAIGDHWSTFVLVDWVTRLERGLIVCLLLSPMLLMYVRFWRFMRLQKKQWRFFGILALMPLSTIPAFVMTIDWGRWFAAAILSATFFILYMIQREDRSASAFFERLQQRIVTRPLIWWMFPLYLTALGKFEAANILSIAIRIQTFLAQALS